MMYYLDQTRKEKAVSLATQIAGDVLGTQHEVSLKIRCNIFDSGSPIMCLFTDL